MLDVSSESLPTSPSSSDDEWISDAWGRGLRPDPTLKVSEWADTFRLLSPRGASEAGRYRTARTPYLRDIMDALSPSHPAQKIVFMKSAQIGATEAGGNWIGYCIHQVPGPFLAVQPTTELAKRFSQQRLEPLIEDSPVLRGLVLPHRMRDSGNTMLSKRFMGGQLVLAGANSAVGLRSMPARYVFMDEIDAYPGDVDGEGDPLSLAEARTRTFGHRRKIFMASTPTIKGLSRIEREYDASDQRRYFMPCPHCTGMQWLKFERLQWEKGKPDTAEYMCEHCGAAISEHHKTMMLSNGQWRPTVETTDPNVIGFHISGLYSPVGWLSWAQIARDWESADGNEAAMKAAKNVLLGETWQERGEAPDAQRLFDKRPTYQARTIPKGALFTTGGADVQGNRIEWAIYAWGPSFTSWLIDKGVIEGDPSQADVWRGLDAVIEKAYPDHNGKTWPVDAFGIDTGFLTQSVYRYVRRYAATRRVFALDGRHGWLLPALGTPQKKDVDFEGKKIGAIMLWPVGTWGLKSELYTAIGATLRGVNEETGRHSPGAAFYGDICDLVYCEQLTAEHLIADKDKRGILVQAWKVITGRRNEAHDIAVYARALAHHLGDNLTPDEWKSLAQQRGAVIEDMQDLLLPITGAGITPQTVPNTEQPRRDDGDSWLGDNKDWL